LKEVSLKWLLTENLDVMTAKTPGNFPTERVDRRTVLPAKVATFTEQREIGGMPGALVEDKAGVVLELSKNSNEGTNRSTVKRWEAQEKKLADAIVKGETLRKKI
jgi:hypothetical protein